MIRSFLNRNLLIIVLGTVVVMASCKVTQPYEQPALSSNKEHLFRDVITTDTTTMADIPWKELFPDMRLQALIEEGLTHNLDLKNALEQIYQARAVLEQSRAALLPTLNFAPAVTRTKTSRAALNLPPNLDINLKTTTYQLGVSSSWELDVWGKLGSAKRAVQASLWQSEATKRAVQTQLIADIANTYYELLAMDKQLAITLETIENRKQSVATMKALKASAVVNGAAVVQSEANLYAAEVSVPDLKRAIRETENALCMLLGKEPGPVPRASLEDQAVYTDLKTGIPAQLLHNRPDVQAAELAFRYAFENTNVARTYFYPSLAITSATAGLSSLALSNLFKQSLFYTVAGGLTQPILDRGVNKSRLKTAQSQQQIALNNFEQRLLTAGRELSNALYAYETASEKEASREKQIEALEKAVSFTKQLLQYSSATNYTDVLTSEQGLLSAQLAGVNDKLQQLQAVVNLYRALGGGWKE